jgi:hypothetical protein
LTEFANCPTRALEEKLREIIHRENGKKGSSVPVLKSDDSVTFDWFTKEKYLPTRRARWSPATRDKTEFEIKKYLVEEFKGVRLREIGLFELQMVLNRQLGTCTRRKYRPALLRRSTHEREQFWPSGSL